MSVPLSPYFGIKLVFGVGGEEVPCGVPSAEPAAAFPGDQGDGPAQGRRAAPKLQRLREQRRREHFPRAEHEPEGFKAHTVGIR